MRLVDLDAKWVRCIDERQLLFVREGELAHGLLFYCPTCFGANGGVIGTHQVLIFFLNPVGGGPAAGPEWNPAPRWHRVGESLTHLMLSPSIRMTDGCKWHGWVRFGLAIAA